MITLAEALELIRAKQEKAKHESSEINFPKKDISVFAGILTPEEARELKQILAENFDPEYSHEG